MKRVIFKVQLPPIYTVCIEDISDQKYYGALWGNDDQRLALIHIYEGTYRYQWMDDRMEFHAIGISKELHEAVKSHSLKEVYEFSTAKELMHWLFKENP